MSTYYFLPWVRSGMARLIQAPDLGNDTLPSGASGRISLPVTVTLKAKKTDGTTTQQEVKPNDGATPQDKDPVQLYGPGDVVGIDVREIIRTGPLHLTPDYPPERFAFIEFDRPDFPWLFTPGAPSKEQKKEDRLRPWLVLVVVEKSKATITPPTDNKLPVLSCPIKELPPNLDESWAWAHAVYAGDLQGSTVEAKLGDKTLADHNLSRLLCPRKLVEHTPYEACLVPAFEAGRKAGLGLEFDPDLQALAHWTFEEGKEKVELPVYYHWSFSTGEKDQFIKLAQQLQPLIGDEKTAALEGIAGDMDLRNPGNGMGEFKDSPTLPIPSALRIKPDPPPAGTPPTQRPETPQPIKDKLNDLLTTPKDTVIPPPAYGSWHAPPNEVPAQLKTHKWLETLNLDPRYRVAAALGTSIIQKEQEHIVAAVWKAVGALQAANELVQRKQLACCVTDSIHKKRLQALSPYAFLQVTEPAPLPANDALNSAKGGFRQLHQPQAKGEPGRSRGATAKDGTSAQSAQQADEPLTGFATAVLADRPVAYFRFNDKPGSNTVLDSSGHNHHGTVSPQGVKLGLPGTSRADLAAEFEGLNDGRVLVPSTSLLSPTRITIEAVISWGGPNPYQQRIVEKSFSKANPTWPTYALSVNPDGRVLFELYITSQNEPDKLLSTSTVTFGIPIHITGTYDGTTMCLYMNGILDNSRRVVGDVYVDIISPSDIAIGNHFGYPRPFKGLLDELAIYDRALSADRIRTHALAVHPLTPLEQVSIIPQFRRMTRAGRSWSLKGTIEDYDPDQIAPPPGVREGDRPVSGDSLSKRSTRVAKAAGTDVSRLIGLKDEWLTQTNPRITFAEEVANRIRRPSQSRLTKAVAQEERFQQHGELGPFTYAPSFPNPMYEPLRDQFPEMLLPGLHKIPNDRATTLDTDAPFIEAYMVGLNHELSREFLWREFPTMLNVTYFQQFWDARGAENKDKPDISKPISEWDKDADKKDLGGHLAKGRGGDLKFLLIRSELVVRYPNALIYARQKGSDGNVDPAAVPKIPVLRFSPITGVSLLGFDLGETKETEWKFFVEEHFTEPYMGDPAATSGVYVSLASVGNNSAEVAKKILRDRFYTEIKVV